MNIGDISKSYFINKNRIKEKVKKRIKSIRWHEELITNIKIDNRKIKRMDPHDKQSIKISEELIELYKYKNKRDTNIYLY